ncbi:hypothetical protein T484DRAFT_2547702 [Baffinella frigidus]|nr:hypothetical protein T484DRAFT_2547702 [Cryptophyta sp. CCMP2293]
MAFLQNQFQCPPMVGVQRTERTSRKPEILNTKPGGQIRPILNPKRYRQIRPILKPKRYRQIRPILKPKRYRQIRPILKPRPCGQIRPRLQFALTRVNTDALLRQVLPGRHPRPHNAMWA